MTKTISKNITQKLYDRIQDLTATLQVVAREYSQAISTGDKIAQLSSKANAAILQELLETAYQRIDAINDAGGNDSL